MRSREARSSSVPPSIAVIRRSASRTPSRVTETDNTGRDNQEHVEVWQPATGLTTKCLGQLAGPLRSVRIRRTVRLKGRGYAGSQITPHPLASTR